ncbi:hypothetical protein RR46_04065 [Papilio xuthus]|uniref:Uncharacterized protein n=1 Tax=Papilio xuthus TaxID=66420 RepID=A0A194QHS7_PAPXU|nr:hypothetical protein RR46_04065 [Papilio xuthus]
MSRRAHSVAAPAAPPANGFHSHGHDEVDDTLMIIYDREAISRASTAAHPPRSHHAAAAPPQHTPRSPSSAPLSCLHSILECQCSQWRVLYAALCLCGVRPAAPECRTTIGEFVGVPL